MKKTGYRDYLWYWSLCRDRAC